MSYNPETKRIDVSTCKNITSVKNVVRTNLTNMFLDFLKEKFEVNENDVLQIGTNEIAFVAAETLEDGFPLDVCVVTKPEVKSWTDAKGEKRSTPAFDRFQAAEDYLSDLTIRKEKREKNKSKRRKS